MGYMCLLKDSIWIPIDCPSDFHMHSNGFPMYFYTDSGGFLIGFHMDYTGVSTVFIKFIMNHIDSNGSTTDSLWILMGTLSIPYGSSRISI
jgi:hypothetical protein